MIKEAEPSTHIIVVTELEEPKVYLAQTSFADLISSLRLDGQFCHKRSNVYALQPDPNPDHHPSSLKAVRLLKVGSTDDRHPADSHFQEAVHYLEKVNEHYRQDFLTQWKRIISDLESKLPKKGEEENEPERETESPVGTKEPSC